MKETNNNKPYGVIGSGSFGSAVANLLAENNDVLLYSRRPELIKSVNETHQYQGMHFSERIIGTTSMEEIGKRCTLIFPIVASQNFREMMLKLAPHLRPYHFLIHGTKGLDTQPVSDSPMLTLRERVHTMSEVILQESSVKRVGCLSGPNLAAEIREKQPAATVIASRFTEVIKFGQRALRSPRFQVYGTHDLIGAEMAGALKNIIAIGSGMLGGMGLGKNVWALLITRGLAEMIHLGKALGADTSAFLGIAGIGDLVATASSKNSRNYTFGMRLAKGETPDEILADMSEVVEGVRTLKIAKEVSEYYKIHSPIVNTLHRIIFGGLDLQRALQYLMTFPYAVDVDYLGTRN